MLGVLKDKRVWIGLTVAILFGIGIVSAVRMIDKSRETNGSQKENVSSVIDKAEDKAENKAENKTQDSAEKPYSGEGMNVVEEGETQEESMEVPKSWDDTKQDNTQSGSDDSNAENQNEEPEKSDSTEPDKDDNENILKDDTSWGTIF